MQPHFSLSRQKAYSAFQHLCQCGGASLLVFSLMLGGCSVSMPMTSLLSPKPPALQESDDTLMTGSIAQVAEAGGGIQLPLPKAEWMSAKKAMDEALSQASDTATVPWDHDESNMRGSITAMQVSKGANGRICRAFLGSAFSPKGENWFEGRACRSDGGTWLVQDMRPWKKS